MGVEFEPIRNWLEIEIRTGPMFGNGIPEWDTDILFKKPLGVNVGLLIPIYENHTGPEAAQEWSGDCFCPPG